MDSKCDGSKKECEKLQSRVSSLEAALSLKPENVERVRTEISEIRDWPTYSEAESAIKSIRKLAGLEVSSDEEE